MKARTAVLFAALLLSACLANARESEWCAEQRAGCEKRCSGADKTQFKCDDTDGSRAVSCACVSADGGSTSSSSSSSSSSSFTKPTKSSTTASAPAPTPAGVKISEA
ncbi:hypothetical protein D9Q98_006094 [Chlorella vulgaris]|uniref:Uncharacterized protein n=1 Tax=Chlorella vulgaris TaxID=3077 RepID=A0A9D4Z181_CHLVU|nr:hypothetical protein D9Q98_006094 [Chlorella vulgaris]